MYTILVLTDFSEAATYAASYSCIVARQLNCKRILFYHVYKDETDTEDNIHLETGDNSLQQEALHKLEALGNSLQPILPDGVVLKYIADSGDLENINDIAEFANAEMIVMGTTGKNKLEKMLVGSHAEHVCKSSKIPVLLVPPHIEMDPVQHIVFACDLKEITELLPRSMIQKMLDAFHLPLSVIKVDKEETAFSNGNAVEMDGLKALLNHYAPEYHCVQNEAVVKGILEFASNRKGSLILLVAKKYNFAEGIFHRSVTTQLAYDTPIPLLVLHSTQSEY